jgi:hypothetical protein
VTSMFGISKPQGPENGRRPGIRFTLHSRPALIHVAEDEFYQSIHREGLIRA